MKKIYLVIAGAFLILLIIISILLYLGKKSTTNIQKNFPFPTSINQQGSNQQNNRPLSNTASKTGNDNSRNLSNSPIDITTIAPIETEDFKMQYSPQLQKLVVERKTAQAEQKFTEWANQNNYPQLINNPDLVSVVNQGQDPVNQQANPQNNQPSLNAVSKTGNGISGNISTIEPVETLDFKAAYVPSLNKIVVEKKTPQAEESFNQWVDQSQLNDVISQNEILFTDEKIIPTPSDSIHKLENKVKDFFQLLDDLSVINNRSTPTNSPANYPNLTPFPTYSGNISDKVYYAQCGSFGSTSLPDGCNLCFAGCGPTTVAMIAASYLNPSYNPKTIVDLYQSNGYLLGCDGSNLSSAYNILQQLGFQTTTIYDVSGLPTDEVASQIRNYLDGGWAVFTWVKGHYFWTVDVDSQGNIFAYDPSHSPVPYNENSYVPNRLYLRIFGVKK